MYYCVGCGLLFPMYGMCSFILNTVPENPEHQSGNLAASLQNVVHGSNLCFHSGITTCSETTN